jgi:beta-lactam-binding protein with PASTA domain/tRNA A-37 threonylcarbamoyl transferase component Bud32
MIGRLIDGRYQVRSRIARGGMATVYLATDLRLERRVAIKVMHGHLADDSQFRERFVQEARSAARLAHPNVVNVFDQGQDSDMAYLVMEYLPGITLRDLLKEHKSLTSEQTFDILEAVLSGLAAAHKAGIVHRDLKPENVLLADDGRIKIGDFGLARAASANTATGAALLGTIAYLSPELVTRGVADTRSDIYAVGIMMYEMLAGEQPFKGEQPMQIAYQHANGSVPTPSSKNPRVPAELDELVLWATAREPDQRPRDARVMLEQLIETQQQLQTALPTTASSVQRTIAMPALATEVIGMEDTDSEAGPTDQQTQVIGGRGSKTLPDPLATAATTALAEKSGKRTARGWWLFALVVLLAGVAGGTGWYFGAGPGGTSTIPSNIVGTEPADATSILENRGFVVAKEAVNDYSPTVPSGLVLGTDPAPGVETPRGSEVTLTVSQGPRPVDFPALEGKTEGDASAAIAASGLVYDPAGNSSRFDDKIPNGSVIAAYGLDRETGKMARIKEGEAYYDQGPVSLRLSLGGLPAVRGLSVDDAVAKLDDVGVKAERGQESFDDEIAKGNVIGLYYGEGNDTVKQGDTVFLEVSKGPDVVEIPTDIVGDSINSARTRLQDLGFTVEVDTNIPDMFELWNSTPVASLSGESLVDGSAKRNSTITIHAQYPSQPAG